MEKSLKIYTFVDGVKDIPFPDLANQVETFDFTYSTSRMNVIPQLSASVMFKSCLDSEWNGEQYVLFNGERYFIKQTPSSSKDNTDARWKHDVTFVSERNILSGIYFYDTVASDSSVDRYVSNSTKVLFFGDIKELVYRINTSLKYSRIDYDVVIDAEIVSEEKLVSFEDKFISEAIQEIYNTFELPYYFVGKVCHVGYAPGTIENVFEYGRENSLISIQKNNANYKAINSCTGVGSSDNIPFYYPNESSKGIVAVKAGEENKTIHDSDIHILDNAVFEDKLALNAIVKYEHDMRINGEYSINYYLNEACTTPYSIGKYMSQPAMHIDPVTGLAYTYSVRMTIYIKITISIPARYMIDFGFRTQEATFRVQKAETQIKKDNIWETYNDNEILLSGTYIIKRSQENHVSSWLPNKGTINCSYTPSVVIYSDSWSLNTKPIKLEDIGISISKIPSYGDCFTQIKTNFITPSSQLMPSIYRNSLGRERFFKAENNKYINPDTGEYYHFDNEYSDANPIQHKITIEDIKPTIVGMANSAGQRMDKFLELAFDLDDNNQINDKNEFEHPYFYVKLPAYTGSYGFNLFDHAIVGTDMSFSMTSGVCGACNFPILVDSKTMKNTVQVDASGDLVRDENGNIKMDAAQDRQNDTNNNSVWIALKKDDSTYGTTMPDSSIPFVPSINDTFVILGIDLPDSYIISAEKKLDNAILKYLLDNNNEKFTFSIIFSRIYLAENPDIYTELNENSRIIIRYDDRDYPLYVSDYTCKVEKSQSLPEITVSLNDILTIRQGALLQAANAAVANVYSIIGDVNFMGEALKYFPRKDEPDTVVKLTSSDSFNVGDYNPNISGGRFGLNENGQTVLEVDKLIVRLKAYFEQLEIVSVKYSGGNVLYSSAAMICSSVEDIGDSYRCTFTNKNEGTEVINKFTAGDQAQCREFDLAQKNGTAVSNRYYWRLVVATGTNYIDLSKTDADIDSDIPLPGDNIVQLGNRNEKDRQNAIVQNIIGENAPSYTMFEGINSYSLEGKEVLEQGYNSNTGKAYQRIYGDSYIGARDLSAYMKYTPEGGLEIKGKITSVGGDGISDSLDKIDEEITSIKGESASFAESVTKDIEGLQNQIDGAIETWFEDPIPTLANKPAKDWTTPAIKNTHLGDLYYSGEGKAYRFQMNGAAYEWKILSDSDITLALANAKKAQDTADGKRRVYIRQPLNAEVYDVGDLWVNAYFDATYSNDLLRCKIAKAAGMVFNISHWEKASKYTDDSALNKFVNVVYAGDKAGLETQIDGKVETWFQDADPAIAWTTPEFKQKHIGDMWYSSTNKLLKNYTSLLAWSTIEDKTAIDAYDNAAKAQDTADGKRRVFVAQPTTLDVYDIGDLWTNATVGSYSNDLLRCKTAKASGAIFNILHWDKASKYTDDTTASKAVSDAKAAKDAADKAQTTANDANTLIGKLSDDNLISPIEKQQLKKELDIIDGQKPLNIQQAVLFGINYTTYETAYTALKTYIGDNLTDLTTNWDLGANGGAALRGKFKAYYDEQTKLLNLIAKNAKDAADNAQSTADDALSKANENISFITAINKDLDAIKDQLDGSIETWFYEPEPTLTNVPASLWTTNAIKDLHIGDLYYSGTGKSYRFQLTGTTYSWKRITDSDITKALADAKKAQDTADGKRRVFVSTPTDDSSYDIGDLWVNATIGSFTNDLLRCKTAKLTGVAFSIAHWERATRYTDDSSLDSFVDTIYISDKNNLTNQIDGKIESWFQTSDPSTTWTTPAEKAKHVGDMWYNSSTKLLKNYASTLVWSTIEDQKAIDAYNDAATAQDTADGKRRVFTTTPTTPYDVGDLWAAGSSSDLKKCKVSRQTGAYVATDWDLATKYTDDTKALEAQAAADAAKNRLDAWAADGTISPTEKQSLKEEIARIDADKNQITSDYARYGLGTATDYNTAHTNYRATLVTLSAATPENIAIPSDFATKQTAYYTQRTTAIGTIAIASKKLADDAKLIATESKNYLDNVLPRDLENLQSQIDGQIESFFESYNPLLTNAPANGWTTTALKEKHLNDTFTNNANGRSWRWAKSGTTYSWTEIADTATTEALRIAGLAKDTADGKRRVFVAQPKTPYDIGDLWSQGTTGDIMVCKTARTSGVYTATDWSKASKYTDDSVANAAQASANEAIEDANAAIALLADIASDDKLTALEKQQAKKEWDVIVSEKTPNNAIALKFGVATTLYNMTYNTLEIYITPLFSSLTTTSAINGSEFRSKFESYYYARTNLLNAIADKAKQLADDAQTTADKGIADALAAQTTANTANTAVTAIKNFTDVAFADGVIDYGEAAAIEKYKNAVNESLRSIEGGYAQLNVNNYLVGEAKTVLGLSYNAVKISIINLLATIDKAIADKKTTAAEKLAVDTDYATFNLRINAYYTAVEIANKSIQDVLKKYSDDALASIPDLKYLTTALDGNTSIQGGLVLTSLISLGTGKGASFTPKSGINGIYLNDKIGGGIAFWIGGSMKDRDDYDSATIPIDVAKGIDRFDGSGYRANGNMSWNASGDLTVSTQYFKVISDTGLPKLEYNNIRDSLDFNANVLFKTGITLKFEGDTTDYIPYLKWLKSVFENDTTNNAVRVKKGIYSDSFVSAKGASTGGGGGGGGGIIQSVYPYSAIGAVYVDTNLTDTFNAYTISKLASRLTNVEGRSYDWDSIVNKPTWIGATKPTYTKSEVGLGSVDNTADSAKNVLSATKLTAARTINGVSFNGTANITLTAAPDPHVHTFNSIILKPSTISGYDITDAKIVSGVITLGTVSITPITSLPVATGSILGGVKIGQGLSVDSTGLLAATYFYNLPTATPTVLGGVKIGANITITNGVISTHAPVTSLSWDSITGKPGSFTPSLHVHSISQITDIANANVDYARRSGSADTVAWSNVAGKPGTFTPHLSIGIDWNSIFNDSNWGFFTGITNGPLSDGTVMGISIPMVSYVNYGMQLAARDRKLWFRTKEDSINGSWTRIAVAEDLTGYLPLDGGTLIGGVAGTTLVLSSLLRADNITTIGVTSASLLVNKIGTGYLGIGGYNVSDKIRYSKCDANGIWMDSTGLSHEFMGSYMTFNGNELLHNGNIGIDQAFEMLRVDRSGAITNRDNKKENNAWFDYNFANSGISGSAISFAGLNGLYATQICADYLNGNHLAFRTCNGDAAGGRWNPIRFILHSGNYTEYTPTKAGTGASGTWGINITGNAATATASSTANTLSTSRYFWGNWFNGSNNVENSLYIQQAPADNATGVFWRNLAHSAIIAGIGTHTVGDGLVGLYMGWGNDPWQPPYCLFVNSENIRYKGDELLHAANYNNYAPRKNGSGASGLWYIDVNGCSNALGRIDILPGDAMTNNASKAITHWASWNNVANDDKIAGSKYNVGISVGGVDTTKYGFQLGYSSSFVGDVFLRTYSLNVTPGWKKILHESNWSSIVDGRYLPLTGGTMTGILRINEIDAPDGSGLVQYNGGNCLLAPQLGTTYIRSGNTNLMHRKNGADYVMWDSSNHGSGSGLNADMLDGHHADAFLGSSIYNYTLGCLVTLTAGAIENAMMVVSIKGNSYGSAIPIDTTIEFYNYNPGNAIINSSCIHNGFNFGAISVFNYNDRVCIWFTQGNALYRSFVITAVQTNTASSINRVENITNTAKPTEGVTREVVVFARTSALLTDNVASATKLQTARIIFGQSFDGTGDITGSMTCNSIELYAATPFIDFHHGSSTTDYTSRLITTDATTLNCTSNFSVGGDIYGLGTVRGTAVNNNYNQGSFEAQGNGSANTVKPSYGFHQQGVYAGRLVQESGNEFYFQDQFYARANLNIGRLSAEGGIICSAIINSGNIITAGNIHSSSGTISAGEGVDNTYGFINVTRPDGTGINWTQSCFSMVRQGKAPLGIGFDGNNSIVMGSASDTKSIRYWLEIGVGYTSANNIRALSSLRIGANDVVNGTTTITSTNAGAVFNTLGTTFGFNKPVYITGGLDLIDMLTIDNRIVANVKCAIKADRTAMSYSTESASHSFNKKITVTGNILVNGNDIYNLGSSTNRFNIGYIKTLASNAISTSSLSTDTFNVYTSANISGSVIINNNITISGQADINKLIMPYSAGAWINMAYSSAISGKIPTSTSSAHVLYRLIDSGGNALAFGGLGTNLGFYGFYKSTIDAGTNTYNWRTYWDTSNGIFVQGSDMFIGDGRNGAYLQIGNMRLAYDQANNAMKLTNGASGVANFYSTGGISAKTSSSDIRLKKDLTQYDALDIIRGHRSLMYHWNDTAKANSEIFRTDKWQFGLIAQDLVSNGYGQLTSDIFKDYLIIDYERLIPIVWRGVQQVDNEVTILKRRVSNLEKELEQLKKQSA